MVGAPNLSQKLAVMSQILSFRQLEQEVKEYFDQVELLTGSLLKVSVFGNFQESLGNLQVSSEDLVALQTVARFMHLSLLKLRHKYF